MEEIKYKVATENSLIGYEMIQDSQWIFSLESEAETKWRSGVITPAVGEKLTRLAYTGLKDKNGMCIFEGDILENKYEDKVEPLGYGIDRTYAAHQDGSFGWVGSLTGQFHPFDKSDIGFWEVIGNTYQTPDLLIEPYTPALGIVADTQ